MERRINLSGLEEYPHIGKFCKLSFVWKSSTSSCEKY